MRCLPDSDRPLIYKNTIPQRNEIDHRLAKVIVINVGGDAPPEPKRKSHRKRSIQISQMDFMPEQLLIESRRIAVLIMDSFEMPVVEGLRAAMKLGSASTFTIGPRRGRIAGVTGTASVMADHHFEGQRSTLFDALFIAPGAVAEVIVVSCEGVMKVGDGSDVPRVACRGACQEGARVANEVGDNQSHELLRELGNWGQMCSGRPLGTSTERPVDFGFCPVPKLVNK